MTKVTFGTLAVVLVVAVLVSFTDVVQGKDTSNKSIITCGHPGIPI